MKEITLFFAIKGIVALLLVFVFSYLYYGRREKYMGLWALAFAVMSISLFLTFTGLIERGSTLILINRVSHFTLLLWGSCEFAGRGSLKTLKYVYLSVGFLILVPWDSFNFMPHLPISVFSDIHSGAARIISAFLIGGSLLSAGGGKYIAGTALLISGVNLAFRPLEGIGNWGWVISVMLDIIVAVGLIIVHFEKVEEELIIHRDNLEELVEARTGELEKAHREALEANELKDKFLSLASHDLRSPIAAISSCLRQLGSEKGYKKIDSNDLEESLVDMKGMADSMIRTIDRLLDVSRVQSGNMRVDKRVTGLSDLADSVIFRLKKGYEEKEVNIVNKLGESHTVTADPDLLERVFHNLLTNALKFTTRGGEVVLSASNRGSGFVIRDNGEGIKNDILPNLFRHGIRTTNIGTEGEKGTGLGLPLCNDIIQAHGGRIEVESVVGGGSSFHVFLAVEKEYQ